MPRSFVRWSRGPAADAAGASSGDLTGEPLVACDQPVALIDGQVSKEAVRAVEEQNLRWGPLRRPAAG